MKKYLRCECCNFLAVIPHHDEEEGLICPFCYRVKCNHGNFTEIDKGTFMSEANLASVLV